jgi:hypothetical protein
MESFRDYNFFNFLNPAATDFREDVATNLRSEFKFEEFKKWRPPNLRNNWLFLNWNDHNTLGFCINLNTTVASGEIRRLPPEKHRTISRARPSKT